MRTPMRALLPVAIAVLAASTAAHANLRAPNETVATPSGVLLAPAAEIGDRVVVVSETLRLRCTLAQCRVQAIYVVDARAPITLQTALVLGSADAVSVAINGPGDHAVRATVTPVAAPVGDGTRVSEELLRVQQRVADDHFVRELAAPQLAPITLPLPAGRSEISLVYNQPTGRLGVDYGYVADGHLLSTVDYHLWPLNGWRRAPGFALDLEVRFVPPPRGLWHQITSDDDALRCWTRGDAQVQTWSDKTTAVATGQALLKATLRGRSLPDVLLCQMGEGA